MENPNTRGRNETNEMLVPLSGIDDIEASMAPSNSPGDDSITSEYEGEYNDVIVEAIHTGMSRIIPTQLLRTFTWFEFKRFVCGEINIDIDLLQRHTKYHEKVDQSAKYIEFFWNTLRGSTKRNDLDLSSLHTHNRVYQGMMQNGSQREH